MKEKSEDALLSAASLLKEHQLHSIEQLTGQRPDEISNTFWWAGTGRPVEIPGWCDGDRGAASAIQTLS